MDFLNFRPESRKKIHFKKVIFKFEFLKFKNPRKDFDGRFCKRKHVSRELNQLLLDGTNLVFGRISSLKELFNLFSHIQ